MTALTASWVTIVLIGGTVYRRRPDRRAIGLSVLLALVWLPFAAIPVATTALLRRARPLSLARRDRALIIAGLPDATDLLLVAIHAGLTPELALLRLALYLDGPLRRAVDNVFAHVQDGERFGEALDALVNDLGEPARPLAAALAGSERYGLAIGPSLETVATIARENRRRAAETAARKLPVRLSFPLVLCILPAFVILTVVPAIFGALRALP